MKCECGGELLRQHPGAGIWYCQTCGLIYMTREQKAIRAIHGLGVPATQSVIRDGKKWTLREEALGR